MSLSGSALGQFSFVAHPEDFGEAQPYLDLVDTMRDLSYIELNHSLFHYTPQYAALIPSFPTPYQNDKAKSNHDRVLDSNNTSDTRPSLVDLSFILFTSVHANPNELFPADASLPF